MSDSFDSTNCDENFAKNAIEIMEKAFTNGKSMKYYIDQLTFEEQYNIATELTEAVIGTENEEGVVNNKMPLLEIRKNIIAMLSYPGDGKYWLYIHKNESPVVAFLNVIQAVLLFYCKPSAFDEKTTRENVIKNMRIRDALNSLFFYAVIILKHYLNKTYSTTPINNYILKYDEEKEKERCTDPLVFALGNIILTCIMLLFTTIDGQTNISYPLGDGSVSVLYQKGQYVMNTNCFLFNPCESCMPMFRHVDDNLSLNLFNRSYICALSFYATPEQRLASLVSPNWVWDTVSECDWLEHFFNPRKGFKKKWFYPDKFPFRAFRKTFTHELPFTSRIASLWSEPELHLRDVNIKKYNATIEYLRKVVKIVVKHSIFNRRGNAVDRSVQEAQRFLDQKFCGEHVDKSEKYSRDMCEKIYTEFYNVSPNMLNRENPVDKIALEYKLENDKVPKSRVSALFESHGRLIEGLERRKEIGYAIEKSTNIGDNSHFDVDALKRLNDFVQSRKSYEQYTVRQGVSPSLEYLIKFILLVPLIGVGYIAWDNRKEVAEKVKRFYEKYLKLRPKTQRTKSLERTFIATPTIKNAKKMLEGAGMKEEFVELANQIDKVKKNAQKRRRVISQWDRPRSSKKRSEIRRPGKRSKSGKRLRV